MCQIATNNVVDGFAAKLLGGIFRYQTQKESFNLQLPGTHVVAAKRVGERPKQKTDVIKEIATYMIKEYERGDNKLIAMFGDNPNDLIFFQNVIQEIRNQKMDLLKNASLLFVKFPYTIPSFVPPLLHKFWEEFT